MNALKTALIGRVPDLLAYPNVDRIAFITYGDIRIGESTTVVVNSNVQIDVINGINSVTCGGGGDFPESALNALFTAINVAVPGSTIILVTDADAHDCDLLPIILFLAVPKSITVCYGPTSPPTSLGSSASI